MERLGAGHLTRWLTQVLATISGKIRKNFVRILVGDSVKVACPGGGRSRVWLKTVVACYSLRLSFLPTTSRVAGSLSEAEIEQTSPFQTSVAMA